MDETTASFGRTSYRRCMIEISADRDPSKVAAAQLPSGTILEESVEYEWFPL